MFDYNFGIQVLLIIVLLNYATPIYFQTYVWVHINQEINM